MTKTIKTYDEWSSSGLCLHRFLQPGDPVDTAMKDYFLGVLPPAHWDGVILQIGEPYSHILGFPTFSTLEKTSEGWVYRGHCYRGEGKEPHEVTDRRAEV